jgi:hypothetical protein
MEGFFGWFVGLVVPGRMCRLSLKNVSLVTALPRTVPSQLIGLCSFSFTRCCPFVLVSTLSLSKVKDHSDEYLCPYPSLSHSLLHPLLRFILPLYSRFLLLSCLPLPSPSPSLLSPSPYFLLPLSSNPPLISLPFCPTIYPLICFRPNISYMLFPIFK